MSPTVVDGTELALRRLGALKRRKEVGARGVPVSVYVNDMVTHGCTSDEAIRGLERLLKESRVTLSNDYRIRIP